VDWAKFQTLPKRAFEIITPFQNTYLKLKKNLVGQALIETEWM